MRIFSWKKLLSQISIVSICAALAGCIQIAFFDLGPSEGSYFIFLGGVAFSTYFLNWGNGLVSVAISLCVAKWLNHTGFQITRATVIFTGVSLLTILFAQLMKMVCFRSGVEGELKRQLQLKKAITSNAAEAIFVLNDAKIITYVNRAAIELFGWKQEELLGKVLHNILHYKKRNGEAFPITECEIMQVFMTGKTIRSHEDYFVHKNGNLIPIEASNSPIMEDDKITGAVLVLHEISERLRVREEIVRAKDAAEAANTAKDRFLAILSHELRTPLTPVLASVSLLQKAFTLPYEALEELDVIRRNVELEARLIDDILDVSRLTKDKLHLNIDPVNMHEVVMRCIDMCCSEIKKKNLIVRTAFNAERSYVMADDKRLQQIIWNLLNNAVKFSNYNGSILLSTRNEQSNIHFEVKDNGVGITADTLPKLFVAFEQGDHIVGSATGGLGLGLSICKALVEKHGGKVVGRSEGRNLGATFEVTLSAMTKEAIKEKSPKAEQLERQKTHGSKILLIEDHEDTLRSMVLILKMYGHDVDTAYSVATAKQKITANKYDLIVSDIGLPDGSGHDLMKSVYVSGMKAIALSGFGQEEDIQKSLLSGFISHVTKPVNIDSLMYAINEVLNKKELQDV